jgi:hypothetical protein
MGIVWKIATGFDVTVTQLSATPIKLKFRKRIAGGSHAMRLSEAVFSQEGRSQDAMRVL